MPPNMSRIHKIDGNDGSLIWSKTINNTVGFGITEFYHLDRVDYIISGGKGSTQERWVARLNGDDGSIVWEKTYNTPGSNWEFDGIRMTMIGTDNYIYASGFIGGDDPGTIFIVYAGEEIVMKIDPADGTEIWTNNEGYKVKTKSYFLQLSDGANIALECYDQPKEMNIIDGLSIAIDSNEFVEFLTTD